MALKGQALAFSSYVIDRGSYNAQGVAEFMGNCCAKTPISESRFVLSSSSWVLTSSLVLSLTSFFECFLIPLNYLFGLLAFCNVHREYENAFRNRLDAQIKTTRRTRPGTGTHSQGSGLFVPPGSFVSF